MNWLMISIWKDFILLIKWKDNDIRIDEEVEIWNRIVIWGEQV